MRSAVAILLALANFSLVPAAPSPKALDESLFENAGTPTWKITVVEGEPPKEFNGTIQDVMKQLKVDYPEFAREAQEKIDAAIEAEELEDGAPPSPEAQVLDTLQKRDHNICWNFPAARERPIHEGIQYLRGISGGLTVRAGPGACDRISCSSNAGIFICNDFPFEIGDTVSIMKPGYRAPLGEFRITKAYANDMFQLESCATNVVHPELVAGKDLRPVSQETNNNGIDLSTTALDFVSALITTKFNIFTSGELRLDDITFRVAGRGGHASIEIGVATLPRKRLVAVKRSLLQSDQWFNGPSDSKKVLGRAFEQIMRELRVLGHGSIRKHENLVNLEGICMDDFNGIPSLAIAMEYSKFGTLRQFLVENKDRISLDERMSFVMQSCRGFDALHQVTVCHADIKIDNALVFKSSTGSTDADTWIIKISDLGQSVIASRDNPDGRVPCRSGTRLLEAPEIRRGAAFFDTGYNIHAALRTDVFSFGLYIWEVMNNGEQYFDTNWIRGRQIDIDTMENFLNVLPTDGLLSYATIFAKGFTRQGISEQLLLLLRGTLPDNPHARKTMSELMILFVDSEESDESDAASGSSDDVEAILAQLDMKNDQFSPSSIISWGTRNSFYDLEFQGILFGNSVMNAIPVSLQRNILAELKIMALSDSQQSSSAGHAAITVSECYTAGFSGSHDTAQVVQWLGTAASKGFHKAGLIYHRVRHAISMPPHDIDGADEGKTLELALQHSPSDKYLSERIVHHTRLIIESARNGMVQMIRLGDDQEIFSSHTTQTGTVTLSVFSETHVDTLQPIHMASWIGDEALVARLLETCKSDVQSHLGFNAIHFACLGGHLSIIKLLIDHGVPLIGAQFRSITPLHLAIFFNSDDLPSTVQLLLDHGCSLEARTKTVNWEAHDMVISGTPMEWAIQSRNMALVRLFLTLSVEAPDHICYSIVIQHFYWEILEELLHYSQRSPDGFSDGIVKLQVADRPFLHWIAHGQDHNEAIKKTVQLCHDNCLLGFTTDGTSHLSLLMESLRTAGDFTMFNVALDVSSKEYIRKRKPGFLNDPLIVTAFRETAHKHAFRDTLTKLTSYYTIDELEDGRMSLEGSLLSAAVASNNIMGARVLLEHGVDVNKPFIICGVIATNATQQCIAEKCSPEMLSLLVEFGADLLAKSPMTDLTPLHSLIVGRMQVKDFLDILSKREQPDLVFIEALHRSFGSLILSSMKYNPGALTDTQKSKASQLRKDLQDQFCQLLLHPQFKKFIDHPQHEDGPTMIQQAAYLVHPSTVQVLLEAGADASRPLRRGDHMVLPLELACITGRGLYATKELGGEHIEGTKYIRMDQAMDAATELLQFHQARGDDLFEGITELHLASRMVCEEAIAKYIERGQSMDSKGRWPGVEHMAYGDTKRACSSRSA
ncbi:serine threonine protein kinase [Fusarium langsethiae]|uniref:Serine threonine protein kinase n=1 Tax=Fusarium langsethiae TaxID=179993 RepID=A0A0M9EVK3_FUSLA|nr:serine threonine protein kinase [Fusarium langsethiae]GKU05761.1 unnamed protein product [Fusarium langsethiae]GKU21009.1 unnamed protein product [Fusarium langsethiae]